MNKFIGRGNRLQRRSRCWAARISPSSAPALVFLTAAFNGIAEFARLPPCWISAGDFTAPVHRYEVARVLQLAESLQAPRRAAAASGNRSWTGMQAAPPRSPKALQHANYMGIASITFNFLALLEHHFL